jgi:hypothetical protein
MPVTDLHHQATAIALRAASGHGFALAGGNALLAHDMISRAPRTSTYSPITSTA